MWVEGKHAHVPYEARRAELGNTKGSAWIFTALDQPSIIVYPSTWRTTIAMVRGQRRGVGLLLPWRPCSAVQQVKGSTSRSPRAALASSASLRRRKLTNPQLRLRAFSSSERGHMTCTEGSNRYSWVSE